MTWHLWFLFKAFLWLDCLGLKRTFLPVFLWWKVCVLVPHKIDLHSFWVTSHLFDMANSCLWTCLLGNFSKSTLPSFMVLDTNSLSCKKNQNMSQCRILAVSGVCLAKLTCAYIALYHSSTLLLPCLNLLRRSNREFTSLDCGLQNSSYLPQIVSKSSTSADKPQDRYWSIPKSLLQAITFLHFCCSGSATSSPSRMFSHFKCHLKNLW